MAGPLWVIDAEHRFRVPQCIVSFNFYSRHDARALEQRMEPLPNRDVTSENASDGRGTKACASVRQSHVAKQFSASNSLAARLGGGRGGQGGAQQGTGARGEQYLTSAAEPYNASGKHEAHMAGSNCCPDFAATAGHSACASRMGNRMETSFRTFFGTPFPSSRLPAQGDRRPLIFQCPSRVRPATAYCPRLSEARLAKHISSLRRTACRPKSVRLHAFHAALVVDGCGIFACIFAVAVVGSCGILAANIVGACGTVCGNGRGWLRRSCGKISSKPAASVVDQPLTHVRGRASLPLLWVFSECD
jgi:hypothetical protein